MIPVSPPRVNRNKNPRPHIKDGCIDIGFPYRVIDHLNTLIPVGMAITMVAAVK